MNCWRGTVGETLTSVVGRILTLYPRPIAIVFWKVHEIRLAIMIPTAAFKKNGAANMIPIVYNVKQLL